jgi:hypothetical protein
MSRKLRPHLEFEQALPMWSSEKRVAMDDKFRRAVFRAVADDLENCPTSPSTHNGTKFPRRYDVLELRWGTSS